MNSALHLKTKVLEGNKIEIKDANLIVGETVEIFVVLPEKNEKPKLSVQEIIKDLPGQQIFKTVEEVDQYLRQERESWDN